MIQVSAVVQASRNEKLVEFVLNINKRVFLEHQRRGMLARVIELMQTELQYVD